MKITPDRLAVARAVRKQIESRVAEYPRKGLLLSDIRHLNLDAIIVAIPEPEPEPLPAPTGPGYWWGRFSSFDCPDGPWMVVEVYPIGEGFRVVGHDEDDFDAWVGPLVAPTAKGGAE